MTNCTYKKDAGITSVSDSNLPLFCYPRWLYSRWRGYSVVCTVKGKLPELSTPNLYTYSL